jgi:hypothetical protein
MQAACDHEMYHQPQVAFDADSDLLASIPAVAVIGGVVERSRNGDLTIVLTSLCPAIRVRIASTYTLTSGSSGMSDLARHVTFTPNHA